MGVKLNQHTGGTSGVGPVSEINVTPLVDVMLVLLIVFMVAAPLMASGVKVDLPTSNAKPLTEPKPPIVVSIDKDGKVFVDKTEVSQQTLLTAVAKVAEGDKEYRIHIRGDQNLAYGKVIETMGKLNEAGYAKIALVSEPPQSP